MTINQRGHLVRLCWRVWRINLILRFSSSRRRVLAGTTASSAFHIEMRSVEKYRTTAYRQCPSSTVLAFRHFEILQTLCRSHKFTTNAVSYYTFPVPRTAGD